MSEARPMPISPELEAALLRCESEPIHQLPMVQPHGGLLVAGLAPDYPVLQVSANLEQFLDSAAETLLGRALAEVLGPAMPAAVEAAADPTTAHASPRQWVAALPGSRGRTFHLSLHRVGELLVLEFEPVAEQDEDARVALQRYLRATEVLREQNNLPDTLTRVAELIQHLTGHERVMVYRFDHDWNGQVVAECRAGPEIPSYLEHRFPANDIPPQVRALYLRNPLRLIVDSDAPPAMLIPAANPLTGEPLDLGRIDARAVSPIHCEYLRNMGVRATLSVALIVDGRLWGLVACHHAEAKNLDPARRALVRCLADVAAMRIATLAAAERERIGQRVREAIATMLELLYRDWPKPQKLLRFEKQLTDLIAATGILIRVQGRRFRRGSLPSDAELDRLLPWLDAQTAEEVLAVDGLGPRFAAAADYAELAAGALGVWIDRPGGDSILWFREERIRQVHWAGNPQKVLVTDASGSSRLSPRQSFTTWRETWRGRCEPWRPEEIALAEQIGPLMHQAFCLLVERSLRRSETRTPEAEGLDSGLIATGPLLSNLPAGLVVHAADTQILYANPRALELLRMRLDQAMARQALGPEWNLIDETGRPIPPEDYPVNQVIRTGRVISGMVLGIVDQAQPEPTWLLIHAYPQIDASGERLAIVTFVDVSDRQRIPFRQVVDMATDAVLVTEADPIDPPGPRILYANAAHSQMTGYASEEILGLTPRLFQGQETSRAGLDRIRAQLERGAAVRETLLNYHKSGSRYWVDVSITPLLDHAGELRYFLAIERDVTDQTHETQRLRDAADTDVLTGLLNRRGFSARFAKRLDEDLGGRPARHVAIAADLDYFKRINDGFGHDAGDRLLQALARLLRQVFRREDLCARFGGEEFVVVLSDTDLQAALPVAERLRAEVESGLRAPDEQPITVSLGVTDWCARDTETSFLARADAALYQAKGAGRNRVVAQACAATPS